mgnify:CR=1 FL=1
MTERHPEPGSRAEAMTVDRLRAILADLPVDRMVLETDSPYLVPAGVKDRRNTPANLVDKASNTDPLLRTGAARFYPPLP